MYSYNLELGDHYYSPMTSYLEAERGTRGETPGALTFSERLARKWVHGRRYEASELRDRYARSSSMARETRISTAAAAAASSSSARAVRAASEMSTQGPVTSAWMNRRQMQEQAKASSSLAQSELASSRYVSAQQRAAQASSSSTTVQSTKQETSSTEERSSATSKTAIMAAQKLAAQREAFMTRQSSSSKQTALRSREQEAMQIKVSEKQTDDVSKKIADIRMQPWLSHSEMKEAEEASIRARARIIELERELEEITKKCMMTSTKALKSAKQMAYQASMEAEEEAKASSTKKSRKVIMESSSTIRG